jgi:hypothetical protein
MLLQVFNEMIMDDQLRGSNKSWVSEFCPSPVNPNRTQKKLDLFALSGEEMVRNLSV